MTIKKDIDIAKETEPLPIETVAGRVGIGGEYLECYGKYKAKVSGDFVKGRGNSEKGRLILVTAVTPTPAGEGKTTVSVGLADALGCIGKRSAVALREPSLGPVFGIKGGAAGGGYAQVVPMEDINLHFTGDIHAVTSANNLLAAIIDNHIFQGNELDIDIQNITWKRCLDINDRQLRNVEDGLGGKFDGVPRRDGFDITVASEIMAALCLSDGLEDLKSRIARMVVGYSRSGAPVTAEHLKVSGALALLLKDAVKPNLVQTLRGTPAFIHGGPFANIAHGCNSVIATKMALSAADYVVTEAGFGADLGAEKFFDIKCRMSGLRPSAVVIVATVRALRHHGGAAKENLGQENLSAVTAGLDNLLRHIDNVKNVFGLPAVVAINRFSTDTPEEIAAVRAACGSVGVKAILTEVWEKGGDGGAELAREVVRLCGEKSDFRYAYELDWSIEEKLNALAARVYRADGVIFTDTASAQMKKLGDDGFGGLPVCVAKTQYSFSDDPKLPGAPSGFNITVRNLKLSAGAGFIVALCGKMMTMPGLPKRPAAVSMDIDASGNISGLF